MAGLNAALEMVHRLHKNGSELLGYLGVYKSSYQSLRCTRLTLGGLGRFVQDFKHAKIKCILQEHGLCAEVWMQVE